MNIFHAILMGATFLCSLVAGFLFAFAVVVMPGLKRLGDRDFIQGFQVIDRVIQNSQPIFVAVWLGSVIALIASLALGFKQLDGLGRGLMIAATLVYLFGVQLPTMAVNVPLNNRLQAVVIDGVDASDTVALKTARDAFESRWNQWNVVRTILSSVVSVLLIVVVCRL